MQGQGEVAGEVVGGGKLKVDAQAAAAWHKPERTTQPQACSAGVAGDL